MCEPPTEPWMAISAAMTQDVSSVAGAKDGENTRPPDDPEMETVP
ncbi:hypothetical protein DESME_14545 [Desulfitobacterium metallireducens DSM 15288]|uniref:Uncharacterized protein n=1 Tax=Desulfitobacterium metallireducens DSM 15288 TaxID=871968 RepID=W0EI16_9FIRM|nr:hypothetical protein DESME_14545 [Desulfitobacterium metallireducens DSM 15288]